MGANELVRHIRTRHPKTSSISCSFRNCNRTFSILQSFRRHLIIHLKNFKIVQELPPVGDTEHISYAITNNSSEVINNDMQPLDMKTDFLKQVVKVYCNEKIPRNKTLEIVQSISNYYRKYLLMY